MQAFPGILRLARRIVVKQVTVKLKPLENVGKTKDFVKKACAANGRATLVPCATAPCAALIPESLRKAHDPGITTQGRSDCVVIP